MSHSFYRTNEAESTPDRPPWEPWGRRILELCEFVRRVNPRSDAHGRYVDPDRRAEHGLSYTSKRGLTPNDIARHYRSRSGEDICGVLMIGLNRKGESGSRALVIDIDRHDDAGTAEANLAFALHVWSEAIRLGLQPLLIDSNGRGGFHIWVVFDAFTWTHHVYALAKWLVRDWQAAGLTSAPETFPKQPRIEPGRFGNWVRLPGRHHTRPHWSKLWDGSAWAEGDRAIDLIVGTAGVPVATIPAEVCRAAEAEAEATHRAEAARLAEWSSRPRPNYQFGGTPYALVGLAEQVAAVGAAGSGSRNTALTRAARRIGELVGANELDLTHAAGELAAAARAAGLPDEEVIDVLERNIEAGIRRPKGAPAR